MRRLATLLVGLLLACQVYAQSVTGTAVAINWGTAQNPASQNVTVPSGTTAVYMFWTYYTFGSNGYGLASATGGGNAPSQTFEVAGTNTAPDGTPAAGVVAWYSPASGTFAIDPAWDATPGDGPTSIVVFVTDSDVTAWRDADGDADQAGNAVTVTLTTVSTDLVLKWDSIFSTTPPSLTGSPVWTNVQTQANNLNYSSRVSSIVASGATQACNGEDESYSGLICISIPDAPGGGSSVVPIIHQQM